MNLSLTLNIIDIIEEQLPNKVAIQEIAQQCGFSRSYLQHQFKATTGLSISQYQKHRLISLAAQQLAHSDQRILDVAVEYGFESQEAFARAFRQYTCTQPSQLRGQEIWAERMSFPRLNIKHLRLLSSVLILPLTIVSQKPTRWGCYTFVIDSSSREIEVIVKTIDQAYQQLMAQPFASTLPLHRAQIIEFREHNQNVSSTYPLSIAIPFAEHQTIPEPLFELRLSQTKLASISLPEPNYINVAFSLLYQRVYQEHQCYFAGLPAYWIYDYQTGQLQHKYPVEPREQADADETWQLFGGKNEIQLNEKDFPQSSHWISETKRAGTRRLTTLFNHLTSSLSPTDKIEKVIFNRPDIHSTSQYQYFICSSVQPDRMVDKADPIHCKGLYLRTRWHGDDVHQLENEIEKFYLRLLQHEHCQYRAGPEIIKNLNVSHALRVNELGQRAESGGGIISFELLTPISVNKRL
ncbi:putative HTH-type transcriptional regulator YtdP [Vibrio scophthalmi]|uniref:helix-turn-helix transcriptional regulator n=1 Tax=Vibrio scophthalmi TaxID=45658 RepID=UPI0008098D0B|nr:AraC family transcriptional regulator [Vibrio scophthalmi]ANS87839.1 putative HTH-type transcriptional regulator YtdP [Vibrio scophthalmi]